MNRFEWNHGEEAGVQLNALGSEVREIGYLVVAFPEGGDAGPLPWSALEPWIRGRAVTVAEVAGELASPALDVALCSDLVYLRPQASLRLAASTGPPSDGVIWALGRAGRAALARGLLDMRASARGSAGLALELASFRLLFAAGDPEEGARAFLEKRDPDF